MKIEINLSRKLNKAFQKAALENQTSVEVYILKELERLMPPVESVDRRSLIDNLQGLVQVISKIPGVRVISSATTPDGYWWVKFDIDIHHKLAWNVVQELGYVVNEISLTDRLPTLFMPTSPPPYLNGGPEEYLSWVIESKLPYFQPAYVAQAILGRLPNPIEDETMWGFNNLDDDENKTNFQKGFFRQLFKRICGDLKE